MKKLKFYESSDVYIDNIEFFPIWDIVYMRTLCTATNLILAFQIDWNPSPTFI